MTLTFVPVPCSPFHSNARNPSCKRFLSTSTSFIRTIPFTHTTQCVPIRKAPPHMCTTSPKPKPSEDLIVLTYQTTPIDGQTTGTSGMRKKTQILLRNPTFLPNWIQSLFNALGGPAKLSGAILVLGGDGRFYNKAAAQTILRLAAGNGFARVIVGRDALLTTPAVSALIPYREALGGIILTASHNPAGPNADWGIKYNTTFGAPAQDSLTSKVYEETKSISEYRLADFGGDVDLSIVRETSYAGGKFVVEVINPVTHYIRKLSSIFDFGAIRKLIARPDFSFVFDAMHASTGEYAHRLFEHELRAGADTIMNGVSLEDFGKGHPDPNLTYAADLVDHLDPSKNTDAPDFGAASDGDGDRNMILGRGTFVSPGDSVAIIADYAERAIPYFQQYGVTGVARSMATSSALDRVAEALDIEVFATPTGWKYFTNLMDAGKINICGEESFGTSSNHMREKDGLWAVLAWLSILAYENRNKPVDNLVTVQEILLAHWRKYGRTYNLRYDYEGVESERAALMMLNLEGMAEDIVPIMDDTIDSIKRFDYTDPVDGSVASKQGIILRTNEGSRAMFRLSGTGSSGATIRIYFEKYEPSSDSLVYKDAREDLKELIKVALDTSRVEEFSDRSEPTVIT